MPYNYKYLHSYSQNQNNQNPKPISSKALQIANQTFYHLMNYFQIQSLNNDQDSLIFYKDNTKLKNSAIKYNVDTNKRYKYKNI